MPEAEWLVKLGGRIASKIEFTEGCWYWLARRNADGYGEFKLNGKAQKAHRVVYELIVGPIPKGLETDHLCRVRHCVNPAHLEPVTHAENILRGESPTALNSKMTRCKRGHEFTEENTYRWRGSRFCRACQREPEANARKVAYTRERRRRKKTDALGIE